MSVKTYRRGVILICAALVRCADGVVEYLEHPFHEGP